MESLDDLTPNQLREIGSEWSALAYAVRNSFILDPVFEEYVMTTAWADEFVVIKDCIESVTITEDSILKCGWLMGEIEREASGDEDIDLE